MVEENLVLKELRLSNQVCRIKSVYYSICRNSELEVQYSSAIT